MATDCFSGYEERSEIGVCFSFPYFHSVRDDRGVEGGVGVEGGDDDVERL